MKKIVATFLLMSVAAQAATTFYVDKTRPDDSGDGLTAATAKRTIQAAVDLAAIGDTVLVAPGVYDEGGGCPSGEPNFTNRVYLSKGITLKSTQGAAVTHIVGAHDAAYDGVANWMGCGPAAVRCILATDTTHETVIEGFTIRGGATHPKSEKESIDAANGGAFRAASVNQLAAIVDCVVSNNVGIRGGAVYRGRCVRTMFHDNLAIVKGAVGNAAYFHFCVASGNTSTLGALCVGGASVNCTYVNNKPAVWLTEGGKAYNTVALQNNGSPGNNDKNTQYFHSVIPENYGIGSADADCVTNATPVQFFAPYLGDYRPLPSSDLVGRASAEGLDAITLPSSVVRDRDITGKDFDRTQPIHVGAIQTLSPVPASGRLWFSDANVTLDGQLSEGYANYIYAETYPTQILMRPVLSGTQRLYAWNVSGRYRAPMPDDSLWFLLPAPGQCLTNDLRVASKTVYVDASASAGGDGSESAPYQTIQAAIDADSAANASGYHVIQVAAGRYDSDEGLKFARGCTNRVTVPNSYPVRILGAGEGRTFIVGAPDSNSPSGDGRGPAAIRCVGSNANSAGYCTILQNLTLTDGYCGYTDNGTTDISAHQGAGFAVQNDGKFLYGQIADCTITNCVSYRGATYSVTAYRCRYIDCWGGNGGIRYSKLVSCVVENMRNTGGNSSPFSYNNMAYNSTFIHDDNTQIQLVAVPVTNCVVVGSKQVNTTALWQGTYVWDILQGVASDSVATLADPQLTRRAQGDYHPLTSSPLYGGGTWYDDLPLDYSPDREGNPMVFVNGRPSSGAFQTFRPGWCLDLGTPAYGVTATGTTGYGELAAGQTVAFAVDVSAATRPFLGLSVNGNVLAGATSTNFTPTAADAASGCFQVTAAFGTNWYVNATSGSDDASVKGWTPETAKKSFANLFEGNTMLAGDVIHAAAGTYSEGTMAAGSSYVANRLVIPADVTVVADEGPEKTVILGELAKDAVKDALGRGTNSTRGVYMNARSVLRGFTVTGGRTCGAGSWEASDIGGGIYGTTMGANTLLNSPCVVDCIISNNASCRGGGAHQVTLVNCWFFDNWAKNNRAAASSCNLFNCVIDGNHGVNSIQNCYLVYNCTFGPDAQKEDGSATPACALPMGPVVNCLFLGTTTGTSIAADTSTTLHATNCVFIAQPTGTAYNYENCAVSTEVEVDSEFRPVLGSCAAVDFADLALVPADLLALGSDQDALGGQRVYNGSMDAGAVEADWRARYAKDIRATGVAVAAASPDVVETAQQKVRIPTGSVETVLTGGGNSKILFPVTLNGDGALTVKVNGTELEPVSVADGVASYAFVSPGVGTKISFDYVPSADGDFAEIGTFDFRGGLVLIFK